jgi:hypothetical protein
MKKTIVVIDGMGGGIGVQLITKLKACEVFTRTPGADHEIIALGTNAIATERMVKAGANRGATGENAVKVSASLGDFILGPIGIVIPNGLMGEITSAMAEAILHAPGECILIPLQQAHFHLAGLDARPLAKLVEEAVDYLEQKL